MKPHITHELWFGLPSVALQALVAVTGGAKSEYGIQQGTNSGVSVF